MKQLPKKAFVLPLILLLGLLLLYQVDKTIEGNALKQRRMQIQKESTIATVQFEKGIEKFSILVAGILSFIESQKKIPTDVELQNYLKIQSRNLHTQDSLIISYLDTNHVFQYSITSQSLTPNNLKGKSVTTIRDEHEINRIQELLKSDDFYFFSPINMIEGFVGIPLCFRVKENDNVQGYFAPVINIKTIIDEIYSVASSNDYIFRFSTNDGLAFDRSAVYDGSPIYNPKQDSESYLNFDVPEDDYSYNSFSAYGYQFKIGAAFKEPYKRSFYLTLVMISWSVILLICLIAIILYWRLQIKKNDLLEKKNQELQNVNEALRNFTTASSHDLKEPLRTIGSFSSLLKRRYYKKLDDSGKQYVDFIMTGVNKMNLLLDNLQVYSKLVHKQDFLKKDINLNRVIENIELALETNLRERNVKLLIGDLPIVHSNPGQMHQLFHNFISNALKFNSNPNPQISIGFKKEKDQNIFFIKDNGMGIDEVYHEKVFDIFQRLSNDNKGNGVGLAICKKIIEHHKGQIWVDSIAGEGSTFYFSLPQMN